MLSSRSDSSNGLRLDGASRVRRRGFSKNGLLDFCDALQGSVSGETSSELRAY